jgi:RHS repeat-associated protein
MYLGQPGYYCDPDVISLYLRARMYSPRSARWLSCDPDFTTSPTASSADINTYRYVVNRPSFRRDPSGLQPNEEVLERLQIYCGCCNYRLDQLREPPNPVIPRLLSGPSGPGSGRCVLEVSCMPVCPGPDTNIPGYTWPREIDPEGRARYRIRVCISCAVAYNSIDTVVIHELQHAIRFCRRGGIPQVCARCIAEESISYERSCNERFPADGDRAERCRLCGIVASCGHLDNGTCRPRGAPRDCQLEDLGIALYPGCRFEFGRGIVCDFEDG